MLIYRVSYDDAETMELKKRFANNRCLAGPMIWAIDLDPPGSPTLRDLALQGSDLLAHPNLPGGIFLKKNAKQNIELQNNVALVSCHDDQSEQG